MIPGPIRLFIRHTAFWLIHFLFFRLIFLIWQGPWGEDIALTEIAGSLIAGWRLDLSAAGYFFIIPFLLQILSLAVRTKITSAIFSVYSFIIIAVAVILQTGNIAIYRFWGVLLNNRAVAFAADPAEVAASLSTLQFAAIAFTLILITLFSWKLWRKLVQPGFTEDNNSHWNRFTWTIAAGALSFLCIRGGLQQIPINESAAYYSQNTRLNHIAVNSLWHLANSLRQSSLASGNPYTVMSEQEAAETTRQLLTVADSTQYILKPATTPNVVFIILESWTADIIEPLSQQKGITPFFTTLCNEGVLFSDIYSSGFRTDQGIVSVLSGFPAQPNKSIIRFPDKTSQLPCLARSFADKGYQTSFYYGGELGFANMKSYLLAGGFKSMTGKDDFASENMNSKWGAHDGVVLEKQLRDLNQIAQPFFSVLLTLSTHEPFEVPVKTPFNGATEPELFKKAAWYTDQCLKAYFEKASSQPWFNNTLFVLVADHGHRLPMNRAYEDPLVRHIPLLITGPLIKPELKGKRVPGTGCQHDIPSTLLTQLSMDDEPYRWSTDLLNFSRNPYAYQSLDEAILWITPGDTLHLKIGGENRGAATSKEKQARAFLQELYGQFMRL